MGVVAPIGGVEVDAVPGFDRGGEHLFEVNTLFLVLQAAPSAAGTKEADEAMNVGVFGELRPVEPADLVVVAVGVVVTALCVTEFIAHEDHGSAERKDG